MIRAEVDNGEEKQLVSLIRIRNPWGDASEWTGSWSDESPEWKAVPPHKRRDMGLVFDHDGEFYMSSKDFVQNWEWLELCHVTMAWAMADSQRISWSSTLKEGVWVEGRSAGGCRNNETFAMNPQFGVVLRDSDDDDGRNRSCLTSEDSFLIVTLSECVYKSLKFFQEKELFECS